MEDRFLKPQQVLSDAANGREELVVGLRVGLGKLGLRDPQRLTAELRAVELGGVLEHRSEATLLHLIADPCDDLDRRKRLAEDLDRLAPAGLGNDVPFRSELQAERFDLRGRLGPSRVDAGDRVF